MTMTEELPAEITYCGKGGITAVENRNMISSVSLSLVT